MASVNKVVLVGNCGRDPEVRHLPSGQTMASVSLATTSRRRDRHTGQVVEETQWHRVTFYDRLAEIAGEYLRKGRQVYVEGRLKYAKYVDQAGVERIAVDIIANELQLLGGKADSTGGNATDAPGPAPGSLQPAGRAVASGTTAPGSATIHPDDDIPF